MKNLDQVLEELIAFSKEDNNIRALVLQGSYINPNVEIDEYSDLDPLFYVKDVTPFLEDDSWKERFGTPISYFHDAWEMKDNKKGYTRLTLYKSGLKLDFGFQPVELAKYANDMPLYKVYLDKDNIVPKPEVIDDSKFYIKKPTEQEFLDVLHDFFFDSSYVVKTIQREELIFQKYMEGILHKKITQLLNWYIAMNHDFKVNVGHTGRYHKKYLSKDLWTLLEKTYGGSSKEDCIQALFESFKLVRKLGTTISKKLGFTYPSKMDQEMLEYCKKYT